jgi:phosphopantothenoylcysteine decarboxylase/phosphopantothenate--cysteine ligase
LGTAITEELYLRGADVFSIHGEGTYQPPAYLPYQIARTYQDYLNLVIETLSQKNYVFGIFSAAVADYQPETVLPGKTPSGGALKLDLVPTPKVIERVKAKFPQLQMVTFKYQEGISHEALIEIARERIDRGYSAVIANRGEEMGNNGEQIAYLVTADTPPQKMTGKKAIAIAIANYLEGVWHNISK